MILHPQPGDLWRGENYLSFRVLGMSPGEYKITGKYRTGVLPEQVLREEECYVEAETSGVGFVHTCHLSLGSSLESRTIRVRAIDREGKEIVSASVKTENDGPPDVDVRRGVEQIDVQLLGPEETWSRLLPQRPAGGGALEEQQVYEGRIGEVLSCSVSGLPCDIYDVERLSPPARVVIGIAVDNSGSTDGNANVRAALRGLGESLRDYGAQGIALEVAGWQFSGDVLSLTPGFVRDYEGVLSELSSLPIDRTAGVTHVGLAAETLIDALAARAATSAKARRVLPIGVLVSDFEGSPCDQGVIEKAHGAGIVVHGIRLPSRPSFRGKGGSAANVIRNTGGELIDAVLLRRGRATLPPLLTERILQSAFATYRVRFGPDWEPGMGGAVWKREAARFRRRVHSGGVVRIRPTEALAAEHPDLSVRHPDHALRREPFVGRALRVLRKEGIPPEARMEYLEAMKDQLPEIVRRGKAGKMVEAIALSHARASRVQLEGLESIVEAYVARVRRSAEHSQDEERRAGLLRHAQGFVQQFEAARREARRARKAGDEVQEAAIVYLLCRLCEKHGLVEPGSAERWLAFRRASAEVSAQVARAGLLWGRHYGVDPFTGLEALARMAEHGHRPVLAAADRGARRALEQMRAFVYQEMLEQVVAGLVACQVEKDPPGAMLRKLWHRKKANSLREMVESVREEIAEGALICPEQAAVLRWPSADLSRAERTLAGILDSH
ncbi:MAG: VWA domain-containing protein [Acidobacteriota bacterium]|nr:VWA domain-containing protein [Acidobacteriota bacterium]